MPKLIKCKQEEVEFIKDRKSVVYVGSGLHHSDKYGISKNFVMAKEIAGLNYGYGLRLGVWIYRTLNYFHRISYRSHIHFYVKKYYGSRMNWLPNCEGGQYSEALLQKWLNMRKAYIGCSGINWRNWKPDFNSWFLQVCEWHEITEICGVTDLNAPINCRCQISPQVIVDPGIWGNGK